MLSTNLKLRFSITHPIISPQAPVTISSPPNNIHRRTTVNGIRAGSIQQTGRITRLNPRTSIIPLQCQRLPDTPKTTTPMITNIVICRPIPRSNTGHPNTKLVMVYQESVLGLTSTHKCPLSTMPIHS